MNRILSEAALVRAIKWIWKRSELQEESAMIEAYHKSPINLMLQYVW